MVDLLRQISKVIVERKERIKYDPADVFAKKRKINEDFANSQIQPQGSSLNDSG